MDGIKQQSSQEPAQIKAMAANTRVVTRGAVVIKQDRSISNGERVRVPVLCYSDEVPMLSADQVVVIVSPPSMSASQLMLRYEEYVALNPHMTLAKKPDFSVKPSDIKPVCNSCGVDCSNVRKNKCSACLRFNYCVYFCSNQCIEDYWPIHKRSCFRYNCMNSQTHKLKTTTWRDILRESALAGDTTSKTCQMMKGGRR